MMTKRISMRYIFIGLFMFISVIFAFAVPVGAANTAHGLDALWMEAKFNFGLLFILLFAISAMVLGSRAGHKRKPENAAGTEDPTAESGVDESD